MRRLGFGRVSVRIRYPNRSCPRREAIQHRKNRPAGRLARANVRVIVATTWFQKGAGPTTARKARKGPPTYWHKGNVVGPRRPPFTGTGRASGSDKLRFLRFRQPSTAPVGLPTFCHKLLFDNDKHPSSRPCSDGSQSFPSLSLGPLAQSAEGARRGHLLCSIE